MLNYFPVRLLWRSLNWLTRFAIAVSATMALLVALVIVLLRYWLLPDIEQYHDRIASSLAGAIGSPVTIGSIRGDWQGFLPHLNFTDVRILDEQRQPALILKSIDGSVSWLSLFTAKLRLASLEIDGPELLIRRDVSGKIYIGNLAPAKKGSNNDLSDWVLHKSNMVVRNARIVWLDEQRNAPPLVLQQVNFRIDNLFDKHDFALQATPPGKLSTPLDVRGEFYGDNFDNLDTWNGRLFIRIDYFDATAWQPWLNLPQQFSQGRGALRGWLDIKDGKVTRVIADLDLRDVVSKLSDDAPSMVVPMLRGRATWKQLAGGFELSTSRLAMRLQDGMEFQPTDIYLRNVNPGNSRPASGEIRANVLQLRRLAALAKFLPIGAGLRAQLDAYAPKGKVSNLDAQWQGTLENPDKYRLKGRFEDLALNRVGKMPGFTGLTLDVDGNETGGNLIIKSRQLTVDAPDVLREQLSFATVIGQAGWRREGGELSLDVDNLAVANNDLAGTLHGSFQTRAGTLGVLDLTGKLTRGDISRAARYTPLVALDRAGNDWLNGALQAGHTNDFHIRIKGNLSDFGPGSTTRCMQATGAGERLPPQTADCVNVAGESGSGGTLLDIGGHVQNAVMEFDKSWPRIENISGEFSIHGNRLEVQSPSATILDAHLQNVTVAIPDMQDKNLTLEIAGEAAAASSTFLEFIQKSPVRGYIDGFTDGVSASGDGHLDLSLHIPLQGNEPVKVAGTLRVQDNNIDLGKGIPVLRNTSGALSFTESGLQTHGVTAEILGGAADIDVQSSGSGALHATIKGRSDVDALRAVAPSPLLNYLHGSTAWDADIKVANNVPQVVIKSGLQGISSTLPQPFSKSADEAMALRIEKNPVVKLLRRRAPDKNCPEPCSRKASSIVEGQDIITVQLGDLFNAQLMRRDENGTMEIRRGLVNFGDQDKSPESRRIQRLSRNANGIWVSGNVPVLSAEGWGGLFGDAGNAGSVPIAGINLSIGELTGFGQDFSAFHVDAARRGDGLDVRLSSSGLNGEIVWEPHGYESGSMFHVRLSSLQLAGKQPSAPGEPSGLPDDKSGQADKPAPSSLPALDVSIENLQLKGRQIGRFELVGYPDGKDWKMRRLSITNPDGSLAGDGIWSDSEGQQQTQLNLVLDISDAGKILARSAYPNTVKGGNGKLTASLSWPGMPDEFSYATLNGTLKLDAGKGQFLKMDPGAGKLLSVLSLQDLPQHVALGFTDVFSAGFQFDNIQGNATIRDGVIESQDFHIYGSSAKVTMKGSVDLSHETQNLQVKVLPTLGDTVSLISLFAVNPAVGIGSLIVNNVLGNPLDNLASFEYNITGTWSDPTVVKVDRFKAKKTNPGGQEKN